MTLTQSLSDVLNYGLFQPAFNGRAGKFLDEERLLKEYPLPPITPIPYLEVSTPPPQPITFFHIFDRRQQNVSSLHECFEINLVTGYRFDQVNPLILQFRYKRRIYTQSYVDDKQLAKLHTKVHAHTGSV